MTDRHDTPGEVKVQVQLSTSGYLSSFPHFFPLSPGSLFFLPLQRCAYPLYRWGRGPQGWRTFPSCSCPYSLPAANFFFLLSPASLPLSLCCSLVLTCEGSKLERLEHPFGSRGTVHRHGTHANSPIEMAGWGAWDCTVAVHVSGVSQIRWKKKCSRR